MRNIGEARMRGYLYDTKKELINTEQPSNSPQQNAIKYLKEKLHKSK